MASRLVTRLALAVVGAALALLLGPTPAQALDCTGDPPALQTPTSAPGTWLDPGPSSVSADPSRYEEYGYAGHIWTTYDLGCGPDIARSPEAVTFTALANAVTSLSQSMVAASASLTRWGLNPDEWLAPFDSLLETVADVFTSPFGRALVLVGLAVAVLMVLRSDTQDYAGTASTTARVVGLAVVGIILLGYPSMAAQTFDEAASSLVDGVQRDLAGTGGSSSELGVGLTANVHENVLHTTWLQGQFGNAESRVAEQYGDDVFDSLTRTRAEDERAQADPDYARQLSEEKGAAYESLAAEIKEADPEAYAHMIGQRSWHRVYSALVGLMSAFVTTLFNSVAALFLMAGYVAVRLFVMFAPLLVILGIWNGALILGPALAAGGVLMTGLWFGIAAGVFALTQSAMLSSGLPAWAVALIVLAMAFAFWKMTKAFRYDRYGRNRMDPYDMGGPARRGWRTVKRYGMQYITTRAAVDHGITDAEEMAEKEREDTPTPGEVHGVGDATYRGPVPEARVWPAGQAEPAGSLPAGSGGGVPSAPSIIVLEADDEQVWRPSNATTA